MLSSLLNDYGGLSDFHVDLRKFLSNLFNEMSWNNHQAQGSLIFCSLLISVSVFHYLFPVKNWNWVRELVQVFWPPNVICFSPYHYHRLVISLYTDADLSEKKLILPIWHKLRTQCVLNTHSNRWRVNNFFSQDALSACHKNIKIWQVA